MNCRDCSDQFSDYVDGTLPPGAIDAHLATCPACGAELAALRALLTQTRALPDEVAPDRDLWPDLAARLTSTPVSAPVPKPTLLFRLAGLQRRVPLALAASVAVLLGIGFAWKWSVRPAPSSTTSYTSTATVLVNASPAWTVSSTSGSPRVGAKTFQGDTRLHVGQWLETDASSRAKVAVSSIGEVNIEPNSRLRLVGTSATDHRVELARGTMSALIWAPPRLFFVDTPSATAVDLGCAYTLAVDDNGNGELRVTSGYVALEHDGRETVIPAGQMCATRRGSGPGTPYAADAPEPLRRALVRFDFENTPSALPEVLVHARADDAVTLWHLLARAPTALRGEVFDTLARDHAPPAGVTRAGIIAGNALMRTEWATDLGFQSFPQQMK